MFKEQPFFFILVLLVDQHPVAITDDEPIKDVDPVVQDVVMDIP